MSKAREKLNSPATSQQKKVATAQHHDDGSEVEVREQLDLYNYVRKHKDPQIRQIFSDITDASSVERGRLPTYFPTTYTPAPVSTSRHVSPQRTFETAPRPRDARSSSPTRKTMLMVDEPAQATEDKPSLVPRQTVLSKTRKQLCKRSSGAQSSHINQRSVKLQTENCATNHVSITVEPMDFFGLYEQGTNCPTGAVQGYACDKATQMSEHITPSELFCIEWIHNNLFQVKLNPHTYIVDDKIRDISDCTCLT